MKPVFRPTIFVTFLATVLVTAQSFAGETENQAVEVAEEWLDLVDRGAYEESWKQAASLFRSAVTVEQWQQAMNAARTPLGELERRKLKGAKYVASLFGAPDGAHVVIRFDASFANKKEAVETVTPMRDEDGAWRVSGYYIK
jgi:hypothetical protein